MALSQAMMFSFLERIGIDRGFGREAVTGVLIALGFVNLFPAPFAALLEKRPSPNAVLLAGPVLQAAIALAITFSGGFVGYAAPALFFARDDLAGTPAMLMIGAAVGPILGGVLVQGVGYRGLGAAAVLIASVAVFLFSRVYARHVPTLDLANEGSGA